MRRILAGILMLMMIFSVCACKSEEKEPAAAPEKEAPPEENTDIVAIVGDEIILLEEVRVQVESTLEMFGMDETDDEMLFELYDGLLDVLIDEEVADQKADELGYTNLSDTDLMMAHQYVEYEKSARLEYFRELAVQELGADALNEDIDLYAAHLVAEYVADTKETDDYLLRRYTLDIAKENMFAELLKDVSVSDEEINKVYLERVSEDKQYYEQHPDYFASDKTTSQIYYNSPGHRFVKRIILSDEEKAKEVRSLCETVDFDALVIEYTEDIGSENFTDGYAVCEGCDDYDKAFTDAAMALEKPGDISEVIKVGESYHIILYASDIPEGQVPLEEVEESLKEELLYKKQEEKKTELIAEWRNDTDITKFTQIFGL
ncbi:MAG: peptidyl-prolyl cis-trans isomerase [Christensenellaceae bacterium]|nr:peptidyl-prolyl cis-trans isomerase [Christensenellaceae bacterium]